MMLRREFLGLLALGCGEDMASYPSSPNKYPATPNKYPVTPKAYPGSGANSFPAGGAIPLSFWSSGGYWDLTALSGTQNSNISSTVPSLIGANVLTPSAAVNPKLHLNAVMGGNAARIVEDTATGGNFQYLTCHALAALFVGGPLSGTIYEHVRPHKNVTAPYWMAGQSTGASNERMSGRFNNETPALQRFWGGASSATYSGSRMTDPYSSHQIAWVLDGSGCKIYVKYEGQSAVNVMDLGVIDQTVFTAALNRFTFGAAFSSVPYESLSCYLARCAVSSQAASAAQIATLFAQTDAASYAKARSVGRITITPGDSITLDQTGQQYGLGGRREIRATWFYDNGLSYWTYANGQGGGGSGAGGVGIYRQGNSGNTFTSANSGQTIGQIQTQALLDISGAPSPVRYYPCMMGDGDNNALVVPATIAASYKAAAIAIMNAGIAQDSLFRMSVSDLLPLNPATQGAINTNAIAFNALLTGGGGIWDQLDALYPSNKLFRFSSFNAVGGAWSTVWTDDDAHPNRVGSVLMMCHPTYGEFWASDGTQNLATWLRSNSPSVAKPCVLVGTISAPAPAASLPNATPVVVAANCTRAGCKAEFKVDGALIAVMSPIDTYTHFLAAGNYAHTPSALHTYTWTPGVGMIGARALTVVFTDPDGTTIATTSTVNVTVT